MLSTRMMIGQMARAVRAIERGKRCMMIYYTEKASRHYRTSRDGVGVERDFCIAMVFGPQPMLGCSGQACGRLGYRRIYVLSPCSAVQPFCTLHPISASASIPPQTCLTRRARVLVAHIDAPLSARVNSSFLLV
jgi:hypothetical protein